MSTENLEAGAHSDSLPQRLGAGLHDGIPMTVYVNDPCPEPGLSKSVIDTLVHRSPQHAHHEHPRLGGNNEDWSPRADIGSSAHAALLGGDEAITYCDATYVSGPRKGQTVTDWTSKGGQQFQASARSRGLIPMLERDRQRLADMLAVSRPLLDSLGEGDTEQTMIWSDGPTWGKARHDWIAKDRRVLVDYKTTENADPSLWIRRTLLSSNYDIGGAWYLRGVDNLFGKADRDFLFLLQEISPPYLCSFVGIGPDVLDLAQRKVEAGLRIWRQCMGSGTWPGYDKRIHWADLPQYKLWDWESRTIAHGDAIGGAS